MIEDFISMCASVLKNKDRRILRRLSSISSLYIYYKKKRKIKENPVELIERPKNKKGVYEIKQTFLTLEQVDIIRKGLDELGDTQLNLVFNLGLSTMARVNAINNIMVKNIDLEKKRIYDVIEKEGYNVTLIFDDRCKDLIIKWLDERKEKNIDCEYLFISYYRDEWSKVDKSTMQNSWIKKIGAFIDEPSFHFHDLRHSGSNIRYQLGMKLEDVSKSLNHSGTQVTQDHYLQMNFDKLQESLEEFSI